MKHRYMLTDLDGTLLRSDGTLSPFSIRVLTEALQFGLVVSAATGRSWYRTKHAISQVPWRYPVVLYNGAMLLDPVSGKIISGFWLDAEIAEDVLDIADEHGMQPLVFLLDKDGSEGAHFAQSPQNGLKRFIAHRPNDPRFLRVPKLSFSGSILVLSLAFIGTYEELQPLRREIEYKYSGVIHLHFTSDAAIGCYIMECTHPHATKGEAARQWAERVGCRTEDITAFGDNHNDETLFTVCGWRVAPDNAVPTIAALADEITGSCDEDGVTHYINAVLQKQKT